MKFLQLPSQKPLIASTFSGQKTCPSSAVWAEKSSRKSEKKNQDCTRKIVLLVVKWMRTHILQYNTAQHVKTLKKMCKWDPHILEASDGRRKPISSHGHITWSIRNFFKLQSEQIRYAKSKYHIKKMSEKWWKNW